MTNGRRKGNGAELEVAKLLQAWWQGHEPGCRFVRTPLSGGWGNKEVRGEMNASGDVMTTARHFPFCVEVKRRENFTWKNFLEGRRSPVLAWWRQTVVAAGEVGLHPMLWLRRCHEDWMVVLDFEVAWAIVQGGLLVRERFLRSVGVLQPNKQGVRLGVLPANALLAAHARDVLGHITLAHSLPARAKVAAEVHPDATPAPSQEAAPSPRP